MAALIDWESGQWGMPGHNVHESAWCADPKHGDETEED